MKKIVFVDRCFLRSIYRKKVNSELKLRLYKRRSRITSLFKLDRKVQIYNGNKFYTLSIAREMFGHRLGEFSFTKRIGPEIHKEKKTTRNISRR